MATAATTTAPVVVERERENELASLAAAQQGASPSHASLHHVQVIPLGAGQEVGRSCIIVKYLDKTIMFDCGIHPVRGLRLVLDCWLRLNSLVPHSSFALTRLLAYSLTRSLAL